MATSEKDVMVTQIPRDLSAQIQGLLTRDEPLCAHTTFKIGGPARIWCEPSSREDIAKVLAYATRKRLAWKVIGNGSNLLISSRGFEGITMRLSHRAFKNIDYAGTTVTLGAGCLVNSAALKLKEAGIATGLEFFYGMPATIGGMLATGASVRFQGAPRRIYDFVKSATVIDRDGRRHVVENRVPRTFACDFFKDCVIIEEVFAGKRQSPSLIHEVITGQMMYRAKTQELRFPSAGCVFKNPDSKGLPAGKMIEDCGLKGAQRGGACVSHTHANFIVNTRHATYEDVTALIETIKEKVFARYHYLLEVKIELL